MFLDRLLNWLVGLAAPDSGFSCDPGALTFQGRVGKLELFSAEFSDGRCVPVAISVFGEPFSTEMQEAVRGRILLYRNQEGRFAGLTVLGHSPLCLPGHLETLEKMAQRGMFPGFKSEPAELK